MIKHVKSFGAELQVHALGELRVFNYGQVSVDEFGSRQDIPSEITEMIARGRGPHRQSKGGARCRGTQGLRYTRLRRLGAYHRIAEPLCGIPGDGYRRQEVGRSPPPTPKGTVPVKLEMLEVTFKGLPVWAWMIVPTSQPDVRRWPRNGSS